MEYVLNSGNAVIVHTIIESIIQNSGYLSEIDGQTGDGDHGVNMSKGFSMAGQKINKNDELSNAFRILGRTLVMEIGGSMGPIYGTFFSRLSKTLKNAEAITKELFLEALKNARGGLIELAGAKPGDKTLIDTLDPAVNYYEKAIKEQKSFYDALTDLQIGSELGMNNTKALEAKVGRAARLGPRSIGFLDAGATSCNIILQGIAEGFKARILEH